MSQEQGNIDEGKGVGASSNDQSLEVTINKSTNELTLKDPTTGRVMTIKANVIEPEEKEEEVPNAKPLAPNEFRKALERLEALGLTWTADRIPRVVAKNAETEDAFFSEEYQQLQAAYPHLPRELSAVVFNALTGTPAYESIVGTQDELMEKVSAVRDLLLTSTYRSEFFFKYAIKIPYFENIDWEIVFKTHERNVEGIPGVAYALLLLTFHDTNASVSPLNEHQNATVAVDLRLVNKLIRTLVDIKTGLEDAQKLSDLFVERSKAKDGDNGTNK